MFFYFPLQQNVELNAMYFLEIVWLISMSLSKVQQCIKSKFSIFLQTVFLWFCHCYFYLVHCVLLWHWHLHNVRLGCCPERQMKTPKFASLQRSEIIHLCACDCTKNGIWLCFWCSDWFVNWYHGYHGYMDFCPQN